MMIDDIYPMPGEKIAYIGRNNFNLTFGKEYEIIGIYYAVVGYYQFFIMNDEDMPVWLDVHNFNYSNF